LAEDAPAKRQLARQGYGAVYTYNDASADKGGKIYTDHCAACHGSRGEGAQPIGPYGAVPPFLYLTVAPLRNNDAGGSYDTFAARVSGGVHATLPDMTGVALISESEWKDLHAYVGKFDGDADYIAADIAEMRNQPALELAITVNADQTMTIDGQAVTMEELGQRVAETTKTGRRVYLKVTAPSNFTNEQVKTLGESLGAVGATDLSVSAEPAPEGTQEQPGDQGNAPSATP
ncbi:MAG: c-type cytochrome, partial [Myxococcota bacterium]|nr:c-type cytochrome [Myxococcota bacterium]